MFSSSWWTAVILLLTWINDYMYSMIYIVLLQSYISLYWVNMEMLFLTIKLVEVSWLCFEWLDYMVGRKIRWCFLSFSIWGFFVDFFLDYKEKRVLHEILQRPLSRSNTGIDTNREHYLLQKVFSDLTIQEFQKYFVRDEWFKL